MKTRKQTIIIFLVLLAVYNLVAFLVPSEKNTTFWVAYCFSNLAVIISGLVILGALDKQSIERKIKGMPIVYIARTYLIIQLIMGFVEIFYPLNYRYSILINTIIFALTIIGFAIINAGKNEIQRVEEKVKEKVFFIKELQSEVELFANKISDETTKKEVESLAETIRFSDPMSHSQLATIENQINTKVQKLVQIVNNNEEVKQICNELQTLFAERNRKAKMYKNQPEQEERPQKPLNFKLIISIIVIVIVLILVLVTLYFTILIPNKQYDEAMKLYNDKQYEQAKMKFNELGDYKDSKEKQTEITYKYATELFNAKDYSNAEIEFSKIPEYKDSSERIKESIYQNATELLKNKDYTNAAWNFLRLDNYKDSKDRVIEIYNLFGEKDVIYFGKYNGSPIAWQILDMQENKVLLITKDAIDEMAYNTEYKTIDWESSTIRKWLNEEFYNTFDNTEKEKILANESDNIFLLSNDDVKEYKKLKNTNTTWWLSTSGDETTKAMYVNSNGRIVKEGDIVTRLHGVRPSIWLNLD